MQTTGTTAPPQIIGQPQNQVVEPGGSASFFVVAPDARALTYEWRFNGVPLGGSATNDALLLQNVSTNNEGEYRVVLTNPSGSVTSAPAMLFIDSDADGLPDSWELTYFGNLTNTATGNFDGDANSNLQEFLDGTNPTNSASVLFHLTVSADGGTVIKSPDLSSYTNGQTVTLTATSTPGSEPFHAWLGDINTRSNPVTLVMTNNKTVFARFSTITFTWTNAASGDWDVGANWKPNLLAGSNLAPGSNDTVVISSNVTVTLNSTANCADFTLSAGTLTGSGTQTVRGNFLWTSGVMSGSGRTILESNVTGVLNNPNALTLSTRTLENGGTLTLTGAGGINLNNGVISNHAGALFHVPSAATLGSLGGSPRFDNAGTFRKSTNPGAMTVTGVIFNNSGAVEIQTGTIALNGGGTHSGSFDVPGGTALILFGAHSASGSSSIAGAGHFTVSGGTVNLAGLVNVSGSNTFSGGTANFTGNCICTNNTLTLSVGTANFDGKGVVSPALLNLSGGALGGSNLVTVLNQMNWTSGNMSGSGRTVISPGATLNASGSGGVFLTSRTLENGGTALWTGNFGIIMNGGVITNRAGALFHAQNANSIALNSGSPRFDNAGTFRKSVSSGTTTVSVSFNNSGALDLQTGTLILSGGGTNSTSIDVPGATALTLGGAFAAGGSSSITGAGQFAVNSGTVTLAGLVNVTGSNTFSGGTANLTGNYIGTNNTLTISGGAANFTGNTICTNNAVLISGGTANFSGAGLISPVVVNLSGGTLDGTNTVTVNTVMNWTGGSMTGSGRTVIPPGVTLNAGFASGVSLNTRTLENGGTLLWTGAGSILMNNGVITNRAGALFHVQNAATLIPNGGSPRFDNAGTFRKSVNAGTTTIGSPLSFNNSGVVDIRSGILAANGGYVSSSNALLNCALGGTTAGTNYGQLQVPGTVTLNGGVSVDLLPGFSPATNDTFTILTAGIRNGAFGTFFYPSNRVTMSLSNSPTSVILRATDVLPVPQPVLLTPQLVGSNALLTWTATSNVTYRIENKADVGSSNWTTVPGDVTTLSNTATKLDVLTSSNRFYRVRVLP